MHLGHGLGSDCVGLSLACLCPASCGSVCDLLRAVFLLQLSSLIYELPRFVNAGGGELRG